MYCVQENAKETTFINTLCTSSLIEVRPIVQVGSTILMMLYTMSSLYYHPLVHYKKHVCVKLNIKKNQSKANILEAAFATICLSSNLKMDIKRTQRWLILFPSLDKLTVICIAFHASQTVHAWQDRLEPGKLHQVPSCRR